MIERYLEARCLTAICFDAVGSRNWLGIEPLVELPLGKASAVGRSSLNDHVNSHGFRVELAAGLRVWIFRDLVSLSIYLSTPLSDDPVRLEGIATTFPSTSIRRPYPGIAVGLLYDLLWVGIDYDELRNGDGEDASAYTPLYPPNEVISSAAVFTVAIQPVTAVRSLIGLLKDRDKDQGPDSGKADSMGMRRHTCRNLWPWLALGVLAACGGGQAAPPPAGPTAASSAGGEEPEPAAYQGSVFLRGGPSFVGTPGAGYMSGVGFGYSGVDVAFVADGMPAIMRRIDDDDDDDDEDDDYNLSAMGLDLRLSKIIDYGAWWIRAGAGVSVSRASIHWSLNQAQGIFLQGYGVAGLETLLSQPVAHEAFTGFTAGLLLRFGLAGMLDSVARTPAGFDERESPPQLFVGLELHLRYHFGDLE